MKKYKYLRGRLRSLGMKDGDLAREIGLDSNALSHRMTGRTAWRADEMYAVLRVCGGTPEELHLYFPKDGIDAPAQSPIVLVKPQNTTDEAAVHLAEFIRCITKEATA